MYKTNRIFENGVGGFFFFCEFMAGWWAPVLFGLVGFIGNWFLKGL